MSTGYSAELFEDRDSGLDCMALWEEISKNKHRENMQSSFECILARDRCPAMAFVHRIEDLRPTRYLELELPKLHRLEMQPIFAFILSSRQDPAKWYGYVKGTAAETMARAKAMAVKEPFLSYVPRWWRQKADNGSVDHKPALMAFFSEYNRYALWKVDLYLAFFKGQEERMWATLCKWYGVHNPFCGSCAFNPVCEHCKKYLLEFLTYRYLVPAAVHAIPLASQEYDKVCWCYAPCLLDCYECEQNDDQRDNLLLRVCRGQTASHIERPFLTGNDAM